MSALEKVGTPPSAIVSPGKSSFVYPFSMRLEWHVCARMDELAATAATRLVHACQRAVEQKGFFCLGLSGGRTPLILFKLLRNAAWIQRFDWAHTRFFWVDERCVPSEHPQSNYGMARRELFAHVPAPQGLFPMRGDMEPEKAVADYAHVLYNKVPCFDNVPCFDCLMLGMGADGHTASLFPEDALSSQEASHPVVASTWVPKLHSHRLTLTLPVLNRASLCLIMAVGAEKYPALQQALALLAPPILPIQRVRPTHGDVVWLTDEAAATGSS